MEFDEYERDLVCKALRKLAQETPYEKEKQDAWNLTNRFIVED